jgi:hypothetical protein
MEKKKVFFIMPFEDQFFKIFELIKRKFGTLYDFSHSGDNLNQQSIVRDIIQSLSESDIIIANLTGLNANVFYELGIAHTLNKKVIIITEDISSLPFDLKAYRVQEYSMEYIQFDNLLDSLKLSLEGAFSGKISFSNPVMDYFNIKGIKQLSFSTINSVNILAQGESEKGFLDFLADIQSNTELFTTYLTSMATDMNKMTENISKSTKKITDTKTSGSSKTANIIQQEAKKVAGFMSSFDSSLQKYNKEYVTIWDKIEKDVLGLIENDFAYSEDNKSALIDFLKSLFPMKAAAIKNIEIMKDVNKSLENNIGLERTMNQAIKILMNDIKTYVTILDQINASIERIISKSRFIVGEVGEIV